MNIWIHVCSWEQTILKWTALEFIFILSARMSQQSTTELCWMVWGPVQILWEEFEFFLCLGYYSFFKGFVFEFTVIYKFSCFYIFKLKELRIILGFSRVLQHKNSFWTNLDSSCTKNLILLIILCIFNTHLLCMIKCPASLKNGHDGIQWKSARWYIQWHFRTLWN